MARMMGGNGSVGRNITVAYPALDSILLKFHPETDRSLWQRLLGLLDLHSVVANIDNLFCEYARQVPTTEATGWSFSAWDHGRAHPGGAARKVLGDNSRSHCGRTQPAGHRTSLVRRFCCHGERWRTIVSRRRIFSNASRGTHGNGFAGWLHPFAFATVCCQDRRGSGGSVVRGIPDKGWSQRGPGVKLSTLLTAPNQLTLVRMLFLPFIIINLLNHHYSWALGLFVAAGISDGLDGVLARKLKQQTMLGQYLDPIADKLLMSTMFLVLSILHNIPWKFTVLVFSRDISILAVSAVLYAIAGLRDFRPSIFGKANTFAQVTAVFFVLLFDLEPLRWVWIARTVFLRAVFAFTIISAVHYLFLVQKRLRDHGQAQGQLPSAPPASASHRI